MCREELQTYMMRNVTDPILKFNDKLISKDDKTIPRTSTNQKHPSKPWFNGDCEDAPFKSRKTAERHFGKYHTSDNIWNFRIFRAKAQRTLNQYRSTS